MAKNNKRVLHDFSMMMHIGQFFAKAFDLWRAGPYYVVLTDVVKTRLMIATLSLSFLHTSQERVEGISGIIKGNNLIKEDK